MKDDPVLGSDAKADRGDRSRPGSPVTGIDAGRREIAVASVVAFLLAAVALGVAVLPIGYGVDPVGTGALFGWGLEPEGEHSHQERTDEVDLVLAPGHTLQWGFEVEQGAWFDYQWNATMALNATLIAQPGDGGEPVTIDTWDDLVDNQSGGLLMPFTGQLVFSWSLPEDAQQEELTLWTAGSYRLLGAIR